MTDEFAEMAAHRRNGTTWFACHHPERPPTAATLWHNPRTCTGCVIKARAVQTQLDAAGDVLGALNLDNYLDGARR